MPASNGPRQRHNTASATTVRLIAGTEEIPRHARSYDTGQTIEQEAHAPVSSPPRARRIRRVRATASGSRSRASPRGWTASPPTATPSAGTRRACSLLDDYGPQELAAAVRVALERDALGAGAIAHILETRPRQRGQKPPIPLTLPDRPGVRDLDVTPHRLETYDELTRSGPDDAE